MHLVPSQCYRLLPVVVHIKPWIPKEEVERHHLVP